MYIVGNHDEKTIEQLEQVGYRAARTALMADGHLGYWMPIGGVAAFRNWVSPVGVGFDIACGNCAIQTDMNLSDFGEGEKRHSTLSKLADDISSHISFGIGRNNLADDAPTDHSLFEDERWEVLPQAANKQALRDLARNQLGTVGSGNHYVDVFHDEEGKIWVGVHFGSRGFGHKVCTGFTCIAAGARWSGKVATSDSNPGGLMYLDTWGGQAYWAMMELAGDYAYAGREWVARHNHHNFAWEETHLMPDTGAVEEVIVIRKGATPAFPGQKGFVGGSMGDVSVILEGVDNVFPACFGGPNNEGITTQVQMLYSTVHGAGRVMGRAQAKGKKDKKTGEWKREPRVTQEMMDEWVQKAGIYLRGGGRDESPHVYRRLPEVLEAQGDTINVLHTLTPLIVVMAGANEFDPYKD
jgi:tRNA-splicing ligase RtcB